MSADPQPAAGAVSRAAYDAQREHSALQRAILECADYSIISTTPDGTIHTFNRAAERMLGYRAEDVIGKLTPEIIHDLDEVVRRAAELTQELGRPVPPGFETFVAKTRLGLADEQEWTYIRKDGTRFPVQLSVTAMRDDAGEIIGFMGIAHDITGRREAQARLEERTAELSRLNMVLHSEVEDRKATEAELQNREEQLRDLFEHATDLIQSVGPDGRILFVNRAWLNTLGYRASELADLTIFDIIHPDCLGECREHFMRVMQGEPLTGFQAIFRAKDGRKIFVEGNANCRFEDGQPVATRGIFRDISKRKAVEAERERLIKELQTALAEVKTLSGLLPVCGWCKKIRDDSGYWNSVEGYLKKSSGVDITHGICPECQAKMMAELDKLTGDTPPVPPTS